MPNWSSEIPKEEKAYGFDLRRTPPDKALNAICIQEDLIGVFTHFFHGRTTPCEGTACDACAANQPARWHGYVAAFDPRTHEQFIFEFTLKPASAFKVYRDTYGTLRGCLFDAYRPKRTKNSRVVIRCKPVDLTKIQIPQPIDLVRALSTVWQLPWDAMTGAGAMDSHATLQAEPSRLDQMYGRSANGNGQQTQAKETVQ